jgi:hypothetical protein
MRTLRHTTSFAAVAVGTVVVALLVTLGSAAAAGAGTVTYTQTFKDLAETFPFSNPCTGAPGTATVTINSVMHVTFVTSGQGAGDFHAIGSQTGDGVLTPTDPALPTYTGRFTSHFDDNNNLRNGAAATTLSIHAIGSDGSTLDFHMVEHFSVSATRHDRLV